MSEAYCATRQQKAADYALPIRPAALNSIGIAGLVTQEFGRQHHTEIAE
jgi:hypothetical protein